LISAVTIVGALALGPPSQAARSVTPTLVVNFTPTGVVSVSLPDGTAVGSTGGTPTTIPAGYYTLVLNGPGGCIIEPLFELSGPGVNITSDMLGGEVDTYSVSATFLTNATYTWHIDQNQNVVYSFKATGPLTGVAATVGSSTSSGASSPPTSIGIVGSEIVPFRGTLTASVTSRGAPVLSYRGKLVTALKSGRYTVVPKTRMIIEKQGHKAIVLSTKRSLTLSTGTWLLAPRAGKRAASVVVS
jgi:hypothetical protein